MSSVTSRFRLPERCPAERLLTRRQAFSDASILTAADEYVGLGRCFSVSALKNVIARPLASPCGKSVVCGGTSMNASCLRAERLE